MSNIIPPLLSNTPPPPPSLEEDEDDEFGDFIGTNNLSFGCDNLSLPTSPEHSPSEVSISKDLDIYENTEFDKSVIETKNLKINAKKDFQDKRKEEKDSCNGFVPQFLDNSNNSLENELARPPSNTDLHEFGKLQGNDGLTSNIDNSLEDENSTCVGNTLTKKEDIDQGEEEILSLELLQSSAIIDSCDTNDENSVQAGTEGLTNKVLNEKPDEINEYLKKQDALDSQADLNDDNHLSLDSAAETTYDHDDQTSNLNIVEDTFSKTHEFEFNLGTTILHTSVERPVATPFPEPSFSNDNDDDFGGFADFSDFHFCENIDESSNDFELKTNLDPVNTAHSINDDDFGEFTSSTSDSLETTCRSPSPLDKSLKLQDSSLQLITAKQALENAKILFEELFPIPPISSEEVVCEEIQKNNSIFELLKDITDTPALSYQWPKSSSQKLLLKALSIDERNILPPWSSTMPLYACNLGLQPLEPIKTERQSAAILLSPAPQSKTVPEEIPSAQFDWKGSGLENPLTATSQGSPKEILNLDFPQKPESIMETATVHSALSSGTEIHKTPNIEDNIDDYGEFSDHHTDLPQQCNTWTNVTPLRETYISNDNIVEVEDNIKKPSGDAEMWLSSTSYITPISSWTDNNSSSKGKNLIVESKDDIEDDFDDFQMAKLDINCHHKNKNVEPVILSNDIPNCDTYKSVDSKSVVKEIPVELKTYEISVKKMNAPVTEEDEFTDFHSFAPVIQERPVHSIQEPLKPVPVYQSNNSSSTQINWPDPGITDEEIMKFEEVFCKPSQAKKENLDTKTDNFNVLPKSEVAAIAQCQDEHNMTSLPISKELKNKASELNRSKKDSRFDDLDVFAKSLVSKKEFDPKGSEEVRHKSKHGKKKEEIEGYHAAFKPICSNKMEPSKSTHNPKINTRKQGSLEEDDWSDFVSAQKASPIHKLSTREKERTSSPDLPLSVFNLNSIQPAKQPIPVITPQGLVQTKLSANISNTSPKTQLKINRPLTQPAVSLPSTISSQFASQAYNFNSKPSKKTAGPESKISHDDDEWGEFVSSPLPSQSTANGYHDQHSWQNPLQQMGWTNFKPNIITNPGHCVQSASDVGKLVSNINTTSNKHMIPNLVLPELDFVAPKNRTSISKKK